MSQYDAKLHEVGGGQTKRLNITRDGNRVTSFIYSSDYPTHFRLKPEFYPVCTPLGIPVTDTHQFNFIHHQSLMSGHGKIRFEGEQKNLDFYRKLGYPDPDRDDIYHDKFNLFVMGPSGIQRVIDAPWRADDQGLTLHVSLEWQRREFGKEIGQTMLVENRRHRIFQRDNVTVIDHFTRLAPVSGSATLLADRHSFIGVRVHDLIDVLDGGTLTDADGMVNACGNIMGRSPAWVNTTGRMAGQTVGVTLMSHPSNFRSQWYCPDFGLMEVSPALHDDVPLTPDEPLVYAARCVAHDGPLGVEQMNALHAEFADVDVAQVLDQNL